MDGKPGRSRIYPLAGGFKDLYVPVVCFQCDDPACVKSCLVNAITMNHETGAYEIDPKDLRPLHGLCRGLSVRLFAVRQSA